MDLRWIAALAMAGLFSQPFAEAQLSAPPNPGKAGRRNLGDGGGANAATGVVPAERAPVVVTHVAVTPVEAWANAEGKVIEARLLAFSAPAEGETGPVEIVRGGKVRFLLAGGKAPVDYPLDQLGEEARGRIEAIAKAAAKGPPPQAEPSPEE
jgi:hypothetical protein